MLVATLPGPTQEKVEEQIIHTQSDADILELRSDLYSFKNFDWVQKYSDQVILATGSREISNAQFIDSECSPVHQRVLSYHNYEGTPKDLEEIFEKMVEKPAYLYKMATMAHSALDGFRMLRLIRYAKKRGFRIAAHCMGESGQFTRILGKIMGNDWTYCSADVPVAPGQMSVNEMKGIYHIDKLNASTQIYALIGDPVSHSRGHLFHNHFFIEKKIDAVYVKIPLKENELEEAFAAFREFGFKGLSVTMPLKEHVARLCGIQGCNTVTFEGGMLGFNTDGPAAVSLMKRKRANQRALIVGWGGFAKNVALELEKEGIPFTVINRTSSGNVLPLSEWNQMDLQSYSTIIQATSIGMGNSQAQPVDWTQLLPSHLVLESILNETTLVRTALKKGCEVITGKDLFEEQATRQLQFWGLC